MSSKARNIEKRLENDATYEAARQEFARLENEHNQKFGALRDRLIELNIDPDLLAEYLATLPFRS